MTKYITVKLTKDQHWEITAQVHAEINRLEKLIAQDDQRAFRTELAFQKRLIKTLAKGKSQD